MAETLPKVVADYLATQAGRTMLEGAIWFRWRLNDRRVESSSNQLMLPPDKMSIRERSSSVVTVMVGGDIRDAARE